MAKKITIDLDEALRVFYLVGEMQSFFHQPMNFPNVETFAKKNYPEIKTLYYDVIWKWLPDDIKNELEER